MDVGVVVVGADVFVVFAVGVLSPLEPLSVFGASAFFTVNDVLSRGWGFLSLNSLFLA